jgi:hypothetical protein
VPGADLAYQAWRELRERKLLPDEDRRPVEFDVRGGIGVEATRYDIRENHVYVVGRARAIAVLPRARLPVSLVRDLDLRAERRRLSHGVVVGVVATGVDLRVFEPGGDRSAVALAGDYVLAYHDGRLQLLKTDLMGSVRVGYLTARGGPVKAVRLARHERGRSWAESDVDRAHVEFSVGLRARGDRRRFVFHAVFTTAESKVLNADWRGRE